MTNNSTLHQVLAKNISYFDYSYYIHPFSSSTQDIVMFSECHYLKGALSDLLCDMSQSRAMIKKKRNEMQESFNTEQQLTPPVNEGKEDEQ